MSEWKLRHDFYISQNRILFLKSRELRIPKQTRFKKISPHRACGRRKAVLVWKKSHIPWRCAIRSGTSIGANANEAVYGLCWAWQQTRRFLWNIKRLRSFLTLEEKNVSFRVQVHPYAACIRNAGYWRTSESIDKSWRQKTHRLSRRRLIQRFLSSKQCIRRTIWEKRSFPA